METTKDTWEKLEEDIKAFSNSFKYGIKVGYKAETMNPLMLREWTQDDYDTAVGEYLEKIEEYKLLEQRRNALLSSYYDNPPEWDDKLSKKLDSFMDLKHSTGFTGFLKGLGGMAVALPAYAVSKAHQHVGGRIASLAVRAVKENLPIPENPFDVLVRLHELELRGTIKRTTIEGRHDKDSGEGGFDYRKTVATVDLTKVKFTNIKVPGYDPYIYFRNYTA